MQEGAKSFNLLDRPWIKVMTSEKIVKSVSLRDAILNAHKYASLAGELPTQDYAVLRLLLAVLFAVFCRVDTDGNDSPLNRKNAFKRWKLLWSMGRFPLKPVEDYMEKWRDRFDLFHPIYPFYQVPQTQVLQFQEEKREKKRKKNPDKSVLKKEVKPTGQYKCVKLIGTISQSGHKNRLFPNRLGADTEELSPAEAARWLLHINGYDDTAAKTGTSVGWLGQLGSIYAEGDDLFRTLMLNLTFKMDGTTEWEECMPIWEVEAKDEVETDRNPAWTLTLQSRHIWLEEKDGKVISYYVTGGNPSPEDNDFSEQMTIWGYEKKETGERYFPVPHKFSKQIWREFSSIADTEPGRRRPGVVSWITELRRLNKSPFNKGDMIRFHTLSAAYGASNSSIADLFGDTLTFHTEMLTDMGAPLRKRVEDEIQLCDEIAGQVGTLAADLETAAGGKGSNARSQGMERYYAEIDKPFRDWLADLDPTAAPVDVEEDLDRWRETAFRIARRLGQDMADAAGDAAFIGREVRRTVGKKEIAYHYSTPEAFNQFERGLRKLAQ